MMTTRQGGMPHSGTNVASEWWEKTDMVHFQATGCKTDVEALLAELKACSKTRNIRRGKKVHAKAVICGHDSSIYVVNALINMYAKCGSMVDACQVFDRLNYPPLESWTTLISGYADNGQGISALGLFRRMRIEGPVPDFVAFLVALKACTSLAVKGACRRMGKAVHNLATENGCTSNVFVQSTLIDMYAKCDSMVDAHEVFDSMKYPNVVSWTALILGYADNRQAYFALHLFTKTPAPNSVTVVATLKACISLAAREGAECRDKGKALHGLAIENGDSDIYVQSTLIDLYAKCGSMVDAHDVFDNMDHPTVVSWNVLILGYADNGQGHAALNLFTKMRNEGPPPAAVTFLAALKACGLVGALDFGRKIHSEINRGNDLDVILVTCLVDFYAKCGSLVEAQSIFEIHAEKRNIITWTALLAGFSSCGDNEAVFGLFERMQDSGFQPNGVTFLCVLKCCSHAGLVEKGKEYFDSMSTIYGIVPTVEHYNCMVDALGRSNKLDDAVALLESMPCSPNEVTWKTVLSACRKWKNVEIGRLAFQSLVNLNDKDGTGHVLMGQIFRSRGMLQEQEMVMRFRKKLKAWKNQGRTCWTNELGEVHTFLDDTEHSKINEIRDKWESVGAGMKQLNLLSVVWEIADVEKEEEALEVCSCGHSETLAVLCALNNTESGKTVRVVKNLRVCEFCHSAISLISKLEQRTVICRDVSRTHVFKDGKCSCSDFW